MKHERKTIVYDTQLRVEAYRFEGMRHPFPNHFHEHYVIGLVEGGERILSCKNREYALDAGCMVLFCPYDNHACTQSDGEWFDYRGLNIGAEILLDFIGELTESRMPPVFSENVIRDRETAGVFRLLHEQIMGETDDFGKEEMLLFFLSLLIQNYGQPFAPCVLACREEIEAACAYMEQHFAEHLSLAQICHAVGLSKSTLLRAFTKEKGITPYRYLETVRVNAAKKLLREGVPPACAALEAGFADQSHLTNCFGRVTGLAPSVYREIFFPKDGRKTENRRDS